MDKPKVIITYFIPDDKKHVGSYVKHKDTIKQIQEFKKKLVCDDGTEIDINNIVAIE